MLNKKVQILTYKNLSLILQLNKSFESHVVSPLALQSGFSFLNLLVMLFQV